MNKNCFVLTLVSMFTLFYIIESLLVEIGDYPGNGVNLPHCGYNTVPEGYELDESNRRCIVSIRTLLPTESDIPSERIFNGRDAENGEAPWVVHIEFFSIGARGWTREKCTGVLITFEWVLTAAHCVKGFGAMVWAGSNKRREGSRIVSYHKKWIINENFSHWTDSGDDYDIALIKLDKKFRELVVDTIFRINPICLPTKMINPDQEMAFFYGYGKININDDVPDNLKKGQTLVKLCQDGTRFCSNVIRTDRPCGGDSGGPLVQFKGSASNQAVLLGILKGTIPDDVVECSEGIQAATWIPVSNFIDWILETMAIN